MQITALLLSALCVAASPVKRQASSVAQEASSAIASVQSSATSAIASVASSASAAAPSASASQSFGAGLLQALRDRQATALATALEPLAGTLEPILMSGEWTIFAPGNEYLAQVDTSNMTALANILQYHVVAGSYPVSALQTNVSNIAPTLVGTTRYGDNTTQLPVAFVQNQFGTTQIIGQNASVLANSTYQNILIKLIDGVLIPPRDDVAAVMQLRAPVLTNALTQLLPDVVSTLQSANGVTVFAPNDAATSAVASVLTSLAGSDPTAVSNAVQGHVLPSVVYSTNITDGLSANSLAGTALTFATNATGVFVTGNGVTAQVVATDYLGSNGVVHLIDRVLFTPAAGSASASASMSMSMSASGIAPSVAASITSSVAAAASSVVAQASSLTAAVVSATSA